MDLASIVDSVSSNDYSHALVFHLTADSVSAVHTGASGTDCYQRQQQLGPLAAHATVAGMSRQAQQPFS